MKAIDLRPPVGPSPSEASAAKLRYGSDCADSYFQLVELRGRPVDHDSTPQAPPEVIVQQRIGTLRCDSSMLEKDKER